MQREAERLQREAEVKKEQEVERLRKLEEAAEKQRARELEIEERTVSHLAALDPPAGQMHRCVVSRKLLRGHSRGMSCVLLLSLCASCTC